MGTSVAAKEDERRDMALAQDNSLSETPPPQAFGISAIERWQSELARETHEGRGIDALRRILSAIKGELEDDEAGLLATVDEMRDCAERHLIAHESETVDAIFRAVFPTLNGSLDAVAINLDAEQEIQRLASLPVVQYERERKSAAERLGMRAGALDAAVKAAQPAENKGQGRPVELSVIEPWPSEVDGAALRRTSGKGSCARAYSINDQRAGARSRGGK